MFFQGVYDRYIDISVVQCVLKRFYYGIRHSHEQEFSLNRMEIQWFIQLVRGIW